MADAEVGDDVLDGDPTVHRLEQEVAERLGKEAALFFPSGTMANQVAIWLLARPGTEILLDVDAHIIHYEVAGSAALSGAQIRPVRGSGFVMDAEALAAAVRPTSKHVPRASLVCVENTHNGAGGVLSTAQELGRIRAVARRNDLPVHMDGARLWNAAVALQVEPSTLTTAADTVMVSFSKGLGAPVGAALAGDRALIEEAWGVRKRFGGGMRQSGIIAAGALYGLEHNYSRLADDHAHARQFTEEIDGTAGARVVPPQTNIVMIDLPAGTPGSTEVAARAAAEGVLLTVWSPTRLRAVFHLDLTDDHVDAAARVVVKALGG